MTVKRIIDGLYFTVGMLLFNPMTGEGKTPDGLNEDDRTTYDACMGAINLLKAQEPRVMTLEEASNSTVPMWFEKSGDECGWITGIDCSPIQATTIGQVDGDDWYNLPITDYGRLWRCWTSCPDQATREAIPWN